MGRHVLASEDITVGEVLVEEEPLASVLSNTHLSSNCSTCLRAVVAGVACPACSQVRRIKLREIWCQSQFLPTANSPCSQVIFCSRGCRDTALATFHRWECGNLHLVPPMGPLMPALRLITRRSVENLMKKRDLLSSHRPQAGWDYSGLSAEDAVLSAAFNMQVCEKNIDYQLE